MMNDPDFAYNVIRPIAVVSGYLIGMRLVWWWLDARERRRTMRNVTPRGR